MSHTIGTGVVYCRYATLVEQVSSFVDKIHYWSRCSLW